MSHAQVLMNRIRNFTNNMIKDEDHYLNNFYYIDDFLGLSHEKNQRMKWEIITRNFNEIKQYDWSKLNLSKQDINILNTLDKVLS